jgi:hypothetical protein
MAASPPGSLCKQGRNCLTQHCGPCELEKPQASRPRHGQSAFQTPTGGAAASVQSAMRLWQLSRRLFIPSLLNASVTGTGAVCVSEKHRTPLSSWELPSRCVLLGRLHRGETPCTLDDDATRPAN